METNWIAFKGFVDDRSLNIQYIETNEFYYLKAFDGDFCVECMLDKNPSDTTDLDDFEDNYKSDSNKKLQPKDSIGLPLTKNQIVGEAWHYEPRGFDFFVGKHKSLYNRKETGAGSVASADDYGDATLKFYDVDGDELTQGQSESDEDFQDRLDTDCYMTDCIWTPTYDRKCIGASVQILDPPSWSAYLWCFVDLSAIGMGLVPYVQGGLNLRFFPNGHVFLIDSRTANDDPLPAYIPICFRIRHDVVTDANRFGVQIFLEHYKE